jgi:uncharacterized membrane protein YkoI
MNHTILFAAIAAALLVTPVAEARRGGDDDRPAQQATVTRDQAVATARAEGIVRVREVKLREGRWKVEGWAADGRALEVEIDATSGAVLKVEFYTR